MTLIRRDHAQLLTRARAALETPGDLDAEAMRHLIEDLALAEDAVKGHIVPWPVEIHIAEIDHKHGTNVYAGLTRAALMNEVAAFCREYWSATDDPKTLPDEDVASIYFDQDDEFLSTHCVTCPPTRRTGDLDDPAAAPDAMQTIKPDTDAVFDSKPGEHVWLTVGEAIRVKVSVDARNHRTAMMAADKLLFANGLAVRLVPAADAVLEAEYAEEVAGYLVDESGDATFEQSRSYGPDYEPEGTNAPAPEAALGDMSLDEAEAHFRDHAGRQAAAGLLTVASRYHNDEMIGDETFTDKVRLVRDWLLAGMAGDER